MNTGACARPLAHHDPHRQSPRPRLAQHRSEPYAVFHPADAAARRIHAGQLVHIRNERGTLLLRASLSNEQRRGEIFVPMHWTSQFASNARMGTLINNDRDPVFRPAGIQNNRGTGQPLHNPLARHAVKPPAAAPTALHLLGRRCHRTGLVLFNRRQ